MPRLALPFFAICLALSACATFPDLEGVGPTDIGRADYPALVPLAPLIAGATATQPGATAITTGLSGRVAGLRARAAALRGPVIAAPVRARMMRGLR